MSPFPPTWLLNAALVAAELGLRLIGFSYPAWEARDADLGFATLPGAEGLTSCVELRYGE